MPETDPNTHKAPSNHLEYQPNQCDPEKSPRDEGQSPEWKILERSLVRKLDMFNYLDRSNIAQAHLDDLEEDLNLQGTDFNVAVSILNVGYMLAQLPSNMIITRVRPCIYLPCCVMVWSCVSAVTAGVTSFSGLVAVRFFLGIVEAPFFPGGFYVVSSWYTQKELALHTAILYSGLILATAFSGLIAAGIFAGLDGARGLTGWQWLFIIEGAGSFLAAMVAMVLLPDYTKSKSGSGQRLLTPQERQMAASRIAADRVSVPEADRSVWYGVSLEIKDFRTWIFFLMLCSNHTAYGFNNFFPSIVRGFNLGSNTITLLLTAPPYLLAAAFSLAVAYSSDRHNERGYHISAPMCVAITSFIISTATLSLPARYVASFLYASGAFAANAMVYSWAVSVLNQTPEKRAAGTAIINLLSQCGNI
ncbi:major facilitator superfamily domain-containing protein [Aspergillus venezuelensis]